MHFDESYIWLELRAYKSFLTRYVIVHCISQSTIVPPWIDKKIKSIYDNADQKFDKNLTGFKKLHAFLYIIIYSFCVLFSHTYMHITLYIYTVRKNVFSSA